MATNLTIVTCKLGTATGATPSTLEIVGSSTNTTIAISSTKTGATQTSYIGYGSGGDWYIRSHSSTGSVFLNDNPNSFVTIGTGTVSAGYKFTCAVTSIFLSDVKISGVLTNN